MTYEDHINAVAECVHRENDARSAAWEAETKHQEALKQLNEANRELREFNNKQIGVALVAGGSHV